MNWNRLYRVLCAFSYSTTLLLLSCCATKPDTATAVRSALDVVADVVDPTSKLIAAACDAREELVMTEVRAGQLSAADGEYGLASVRQKCVPLEDAINKIRFLHRQALEFERRGSFDEAMALLDEAREILKNLKPGGSPTP